MSLVVLMRPEKETPQGSPEVGAQDGTGERKQLGHRGLSMRRTTT